MKTLGKKPLVSIGLPVYNGEKYVGKAIESVLTQTFEDFELIISDNASTDRTEEICREYTANDPRIHYYRNERNLGAAKNFNRVFELSTGELFKWLAADSAIKPTFLAQCVELLDKDPTIILAHTMFISRSEFKDTTKLHYGDLDFRSPMAHRRFCKLLRGKFGRKLPIWGLIESSVLRDTRLIRPFIGSDDCLLIELILKGGFGIVPEHLVLIRRHVESYTNIKDTNNGVEGAAEAQWFDPENKGTFYLPHWRRLWEYFLLAVCSKESFGSKCIMVAFLVYPVGTKWLKRLIMELFFAFGLKHLYFCIRRVKKRICKQSTAPVG